jgi:hypothetical protein
MARQHGLHPAISFQARPDCRVPDGNFAWSRAAVRCSNTGPDRSSAFGAYTIKLEIEGVTDPFATVRTQDGDSGAAGVQDGMIDSTARSATRWRPKPSTSTRAPSDGQRRWLDMPAYPFSDSIKVKTRDFG